MGHYKSNLRDLEFTLFDVLGRSDVYGTGAFAGTGQDTARAVLAEVERLAVHQLADASVAADRTPPVHDPRARSVTLPDSFKRAYRAWTDGGWHLLDLPASLGGADAPPSLRWAVAELALGANPALYLYQGFTGFARVLDRLGTEEQQRLAQLMVDRQWGATMVLTEPEAGSDVGACRTRARKQPDGTWHLEGVKRFITSGEHDLAENIVHFVLARPDGHGPGTKGLSLFLVPKFRIADPAAGRLGARNGVHATALEDKMGLKASATCELTFGAEEPAVGMLLGEEHNGIRQMFQIIEQARMIVGTKSAATLSTGYLNAVEYAKERIQGTDLTALGDRSAPKVPITRHPEVRRSLLLQKGYAEGLRALVLYTATLQDRITAAQAEGRTDEEATARNDLLLPVVKGYSSERACEQLNHALQILGGAGYMKDFPLEQYIRDTKIDTLYEGTTAIQGQDFFFRKIARDQGAALDGLLTEVEKETRQEAGGALAAERALLAEAVTQVRAMADALGTYLLRSLEEPAAIHQVGRNTTRLLMATGDLLLGWLLLRQAGVAAEQLDSGEDGRNGAGRAFRLGKIATARFFAQEVLPLITTERALAERHDSILMELPDDAW
ncbi:acyl-CoA dehydrogenase [Streptomyces tubbatahanensis]|uniref:Acyl-CoA dehydrogenase n=1 Tax=Streptomyces tubbatahanensis TaxID=2923272 RepID=A0ABY3XX52_9ACTN|nr:acyl-CoA dehydrogenase [Streptomyces tubbatahanensis]UNS99102.1 acyl-CoA dehydrogenase [Streptomyces tubbatahanensis]